jgi:hypothetical protein
MRTARSLLLASLALAACQGARSPDGATESGGSAVDPSRPVVASLTVRDGAGAEGPYRIADLERLSVEVRLGAAQPGDHQVQLEVLNPDGGLYSRLPVHVEVGPDGAGAGWQLVEVRGTSIESLHRTGTWQFRVSLSDASPPLAHAEAKVTE